MRKNTVGPEGESRTPVWEVLEEVVREKAQEFIQQILEEEVTELLGREKSERRRVVDATEGYRNGYGKPRHWSTRRAPAAGSRGVKPRPMLDSSSASSPRRHQRSFNANRHSACSDSRHSSPSIRLFQHAGIRSRPTASAADRAVLVELRRFLAVIHIICTLPRQPIGARTCSSAGVS